MIRLAMAYMICHGKSIRPHHPEAANVEWTRRKARRLAANGLLVRSMAQSEKGSDSSGRTSQEI